MSQRVLGFFGAGYHVGYGTGAASVIHLSLSQGGEQLREICWVQRRNTPHHANWVAGPCLVQSVVAIRHASLGVPG